MRAILDPNVIVSGVVFGGVPARILEGALRAVDCIHAHGRIARPERVPELQQLPEPFDRQARIADDATHRERVDGVGSRNRENPGAIRHDDVLTLTKNPKARLFQGTNRVEV